MLKRFLSYYRPHKKIFSLDMAASFAVSMIGILYPHCYAADVKQPYSEQEVRFNHNFRSAFAFNICHSYVAQLFHTVSGTCYGC